MSTKTNWYSHNVCAFRNSGIVYSGRMFQDSYQYPMLCQHFITVNFHCFHLIVTIACYGVDTIAIAAYWNENYDDESNESKMHNRRKHKKKCMGHPSTWNIKKKRMPLSISILMIIMIISV
ncbi:hypothetical protein DERP_000896 [Dermatophagoides pteronyssinus]|uniref:Uncharacterized protein n=1 Tax=Dermatophagoides pteronyssinus TaxID=6956 RepID=A0ABQ8JCY0_DERPT|nr:hypothetical protein DERP_000896 [Dermatophagoides pteronyssinus]